jgi:hypothetical protein
MEGGDMDSAVSCTGNLQNAGMNQPGQIGTTRRVIIGLDAMDIALSGGIEMDADEYRVGLPIRYCHPSIERNKHVGAPR